MTENPKKTLEQLKEFARKTKESYTFPEFHIEEDEMFNNAIAIIEECILLKEAKAVQEAEDSWNSKYGKLNLCVKCQSKARLDVEDVIFTVVYKVSCSNEECEEGTTEYENPVDAVDDWNNKSLQDQLTEILTGLTEIINLFEGAKPNDGK